MSEPWRTPVRLYAEALPDVAGRGIPVPRYDRTALHPRILHLGVGGFHRAHLALYTHELAERGSDWAIRGLGTLPGDRRMAEALGRQDHLYTLIERGNDEPRPRVVGSIVDYVLAVDDQAEVSRLIAAPEVEILSLTITEAGYFTDTENLTFVAIVDGLAARLAAGGAPITLLSCDNLPGNGAATRAATMRSAADRDPALVRWIEANCAFPNSMVDRITPMTAETDREWLRDTWGLIDEWPVVCEPFRQWVLEDDFAAGRPRWEEVGVLVSDRVHDWELYKLRMLNATHSCMAYLSALAGIVFVDEAMAVPAMRRFLERLLLTEAVPTLAEIPGHPREDYAATVLERFENTGVRDQIARLCIDGTAKFPTFLIPTIARQVEIGGPVECAALALAGWARYLADTPDGDRAADASGHVSAAAARAAASDPARFLDLDLVFPAALRESDRFRSAFRKAWERLDALGPLGAVAELG